ncbi:MAG: 16S rRNA processing protein RimM [Bacteroidales bacterium]|nr:16S rRNA processing protein RimM [Bacteroidales bacterium]
MFNDYFYLGTLTKPFGLKGGLCAFFDADNPERYQTLTAVFLDLDGELIPYQIDKIQYRGRNQFIIFFHDIDADEAKDLIQADLYLPLSELPPLEGNRFYFHEVVGFQVHDKAKGYIGNCIGFLELANNPVMQIDHDGVEILIPASQQFVTKVDRDNKVLYVDTPEGLIDVYLT